MTPSIWNPRTQIILAIVLLTSSAAYLWWTLRAAPRLEELAAMSERSAALSAANQLARRAVGEEGMERVRRAIEAYARQAEAVASLLPSDSVARPLLPTISELARAFDITLTELAPLAKTRGDEYDIETYSVKLRGRYHDLGAFLAAIGNLDQIVHIREMNASVMPFRESSAGPSGVRLIEASFKLEAYFQPTGDQQNASSSASPSVARSAGSSGDSTSQGSGSDQAKPTIEYERDARGRLWQLIYVPGKPTPVRIPVPAAARAQAEAALSRGGGYMP